MVANGKDETSRRTVLKVTSATAVGALGSLAGCTGSEGDGGNTESGGAESGGTESGGTESSGTESSGTESSGTESSGTESGGGQESITVSFLSATAAENSITSRLFDESMRRFEQQQGNVTVDLSTASFGDIKNKLASTVEAGNAPALAQSGSLGLNFFKEGTVPVHDSYLESTEGIPDKWHPVNVETARYRGEYWCGGAAAHTVWGLGVRPKLVSQVGVTDPESELETWSGLLDVIQRVDEQLDTIAWEETGTPGDLESYWTEARSAHTDGKDPWIRGSYSDPEVIVNNGEESGRRTDGMMKNCLKLAEQYSSSSVPQRADEEVPALIMTDKVAIYPHIATSWTGFTSVKSDATFGWQGGDGDVMYLPMPKLDPEYGEKVGISELEGLSGQHGGHVSGLESSHTLFEKEDQRVMDAAWKLNVYMQTDKQHVLDIFGRGDPAIPTYQPLVSTLTEEIDVPQIYSKAAEAFNEYGGQFMSTGANWDVGGTDQIRWTNINETLSQALAGQYSASEVPGLIRDRINTTLSEQN